jgi:hypothetical protein
MACYRKRSDRVGVRDNIVDYFCFCVMGLIGFASFIHLVLHYYYRLVWLEKRLENLNAART